jgi:hypothetical protein
MVLAMPEHLAVVSPKTLRGLLRRPVLTWNRRRREAPIGRVRKGELVFLKTPGGAVVASGRVSRCTEERRGGRYVLHLRFRDFERLAVPFPVVKRDRRSWVTCAPPRDAAQQRLLAARAPTLKELLQAVHAGRRRLPTRRQAARILAQVALQQRAEGSLLLWLALLAVLQEADHALDAVTEYARKPPRRVVPFAVFS